MKMEIGRGDLFLMAFAHTFGTKVWQVCVEQMNFYCFGLLVIKFKGKNKVANKTK